MLEIVKLCASIISENETELLEKMAMSMHVASSNNKYLHSYNHRYY